MSDRWSFIIGAKLRRHRKCSFSRLLTHLATDMRSIGLPVELHIVLLQPHQAIANSSA